MVGSQPGQFSWINAGLPSERPREGTLAGPTFRVFELLRRKYCLRSVICKRLDFRIEYEI